MLSFPGHPEYASTRKLKPFCILMRQEIMGFWERSNIGWTICKQYCTLLQTYNHANSSSLNFNGPDALSDARPTMSKHLTGYRMKDTGQCCAVVSHMLQSREQLNVDIIVLVLYNKRICYVLLCYASLATAWKCTMMFSYGLCWVHVSLIPVYITNE